jgi:hypothetical protein
MITFFAAVLIRPDVQTMVQKQLDAVTGRERLPTFEDRPRLPLVDAVCKEVLRWRPVTPLGESMLPADRPPKRSHDAQPSPMQQQKIMSTKVTSFPRVGRVSLPTSFTDDRCVFSGAMAIGNSWCDDFRLPLSLAA